VMKDQDQPFFQSKGGMGVTRPACGVFSSGTKKETEQKLGEGTKKLTLWDRKKAVSRHPGLKMYRKASKTKGGEKSSLTLRGSQKNGKGSVGA